MASLGFEVKWWQQSGFPPKDFLWQDDSQHSSALPCCLGPPMRSTPEDIDVDCHCRRPNHSTLNIHKEYPIHGSKIPFDILKLDSRL